MLSDLKQHYANALTSGVHLALLLLGFQIDTPLGWQGVLALVSAISFFAWIGNYRRHRSITDTPTSRVASAAQGYVELVGKAAQHPVLSFLSKLTALPCLWFRYRTERKTGDNKWEVVDRGVSSETFLLVDGSGECVIDPDDAEIMTSHKQIWRQGDYRHTEWLLLPGDRLYVLGDFVTLGGAAAPLDPGQDTAALLTEWKKDRPTLMRRFDLNEDGEIDLKEWELARRQARREVEKHHAEIYASDNSVHLMRRPTDGRLYVVSNLEPDKLARKYVLWGVFHLLVFLAAAVGAVVVQTSY